MARESKEIQDIDKNQKYSFNSAFGDKVVVERHADIEEQFHYNIADKSITTTLVGSGTVTQGNDMIVVSSGVDTDGSAIAKSTHNIRYRPGFEGYALFTALWETTAAAGVKQFIGAFDTNDGFYVGYNGTDFVVGRRLGGTDTEVTQANWNGEGSADKLDTTKLNIFRITWGWLGTANILFQRYDQTGKWVTMHNMQIANTLTRPSINNPVLPICMDVTKTSGATDFIMKSGSWNGGMMGDDTEVGDRYFTAHEDATTVSTEQVLLNLENQSTFQSKTNKVNLEFTFFSCAADGTKTARFKIYKNLAIGGTPSWSAVDSGNSVVRKDTAGTITPNDANLEFEFEVAKTGGVTTSLKDIKIELNPTETLTVTGQSASNTDLHFSIRWKEHF